MLALKKDQDDDNNGCLLIAIPVSFLVICLIKWVWPDVIPYRMFEFFNWHISIVQLWQLTWPLWIYTGFVLIIQTTSILLEDDKYTIRYIWPSPIKLFVSGIFISFYAGITEEIFFRWLLFYQQIVAYKIFNYITFGLVAWLYLHISRPFICFVSRGSLSQILLTRPQWFIGGSILTSNGRFQDGHKHLGCFGYVNSWIIGIYLFYILFNSGLIACIIVHVIYDLIVFSSGALAIYIKKRT